MTKKICFGIVTVLLSFFLAQLSYADKIDKIVAFGDSMTDNGNIFRLTSAAHKVLPIIPVIPKDPPYYQGRFSNGPNWVDNLSLAMGVPLENYAYGGSWAEPITDSKLNVPFGLDVQVAYYLLSSALDFHKYQHLYIIWAGSNDYIKGREDPEYATTNTVEVIRKQIEWLIYYGAKNIFVLNVPNLGVVPEVASRGKEAAQEITDLVNLHNKKLATMLKKLQRLYPDAHIVAGDTTRYFDDIIINPGKYKLTNVTEACYGGGYWLRNKLASSPEIQAAKEANIDILNSPSLREAYLVAQSASYGERSCSNSHEYLFWDQLHPTQAVHAIISRYALKKLLASRIES